MKVFKNIGSGFFWGVGFTLGLMLVVFIFDEFELTPQEKKKKKPIVKAVSPIDIEKITTRVEKVEFFQGRVIVSTSTFNSNSVPLEDVKLLVTVYYENQPIEECFDWTFNMGASEENKHPVFCKWRWKDLVEDKLSATSRVELSMF